MSNYDITLPLTREVAAQLRAGDSVRLTGTLYSARDAAHKRLNELLDAGLPLPIPIENATIYYAGPTPAPEGYAVGAIGPTTSGRMDAYAPRLIALGLCGMIGKGERDALVVRAIRKHGAVYFGAIGGAGALLAEHVEDADIVAFPELGAEALRRLTVRDFPAVVVIDSTGMSLYESGRAEYLKSLK
ncbi:MAG: Fe-S-containing hydro-lyase [Oscillospiraceae bacterium]|jgi:fumarate hydratase subunit beta|nr:Fe-S-containing hydro-lyase [Oscillospiraceae bacterium]